MKKLLVLALTLIMTFLFIACSPDNSAKQVSTANNKPKLITKAKKVLVVYFSREGNTQKNGKVDAMSGASLPSGCVSEIAAQIHKKVGGDIFEIVT